MKLFLLLTMLVLAGPLPAQTNDTDFSKFRFEGDKMDTKIIDPELTAILRNNCARLQAGKTNATDIADYVHSYETLLTKHAGEKSEAAAQILFLEFQFIYGELGDDQTGAKMLYQLARDYPDTQLGRKIGKMNQEPENAAITEPVSLAGNPWAVPLHGGFTLSLVRSLVLSNDCVLAPLTAAGQTNLVVAIPDLNRTNEHCGVFSSDFLCRDGIPRISPDGTRLLMFVNPASTQMLDAFTHEPVGTPLKHEAKVNLGMFSPDNQLLATAAADGVVRIWNTRDGQSIGNPIVSKPGTANIFFSGDSSRLCVATSNSVVTVWDARTGRQVGKPFQCGDEVWVQAHTGSGERTVFSPDGRILLDGQDPYWLWNVETGRQSKDSIDQGDKIFDIVFSPDSKRVVTVAGANTRAARVWDAQTGLPLTKSLRHRHCVFTAQFLPDGRRFVTTCLDGAARIWDSVTGELLVLCYHPEASTPTVALSPDGLYLVTLGGKVARIWSTATGEMLAKPMEFPDDVEEARFSQDSQAFVTVTAAQQVQVWQIAKIVPDSICSPGP